LSLDGDGPCITSATFGKVTDYGVTDVNNFGGIMAPAALNTLLAVFHDTKTSPEDYDLILTGDLGKFGSEVLLDLLERHNVVLGKNYSDCGQMYFSKSQQTLMGGSGCGCCASILNSVIVNQMKKGVFNKVLLVATGALLSTTSSQQGDTLPAIAHAVVLENKIKKQQKIK
jgi:stage V sporulation protein AD